MASRWETGVSVQSIEQNDAQCFPMPPHTKQRSDCPFAQKNRFSFVLGSGVLFPPFFMIKLLKLNTPSRKSKLLLQ